jgi:membrane-associated protease RseP (regulator of RpoE activity)
MSEIIREGTSTAADAPVIDPGRTGAVATDAPPPPSSPVTAGEKSSPVGLVVLIGLLVFAGVAGGISLVIVILSLVFMIFMHELGHFLAARRGGMKATEFFIGFGPKLWSFRRGETEYGFKGIPLGAYVRIIGMNNLEEVDPEDEPRTYRQQSYPRRMLVAVAGSGMHFLMALVLLYAVLVTNGIDVDEVAADTDWTIEAIEPGGPAEAIGLQEGDRILAAGGTEFATWTDTRLFIEANPAETFDFTVLRDGETIVLTGAIGAREGEPGVGRIGVARSQAPFIQEGPLEAIPKTVTEFGSAVKLTMTSLVDFFNPSSLADFFGRLDGTEDTAATTTPAGGAGNATAAETEEEEGRILSIVGATRIGAQLTDEGITGLLLFMFSINVFVGVFNLIPLLPLDGGHVAVATYERLRSRGGRRYHADVGKLVPLTYAVVLVLITVGVAAIYLDIADPVSL